MGPHSVGAADLGEPKALTSSVYTLVDEEREWLRAVHNRLWPAQVGSLRPRRDPPPKQLSQTELEGILGVIQERSLITSMFCSGMFGGYGMNVYEHEPFPGAGPLLLLALAENHLPGTCVKRPGEGRDDAWEIFSRFTHSEKNAQWLQSYRMDPPRSRTFYDY